MPSDGGGVVGCCGGVGVGAGVGVGVGVGAAVGTGVGVGARTAVGVTVGRAVGVSIGIVVAVATGFGVESGMSVGALVAPSAKEKGTANPGIRASRGTAPSGTSNINRPVTDSPGNNVSNAPSSPPSALISSSVEGRGVYASASIPPNGDHTV